MVSLKKSAADRRAEKDALGEPGLATIPEEDEGVRVNLDHHHLMKMGVGGGMKSGHKVDFSGSGSVERSETRSTPQGERHSATIRLNRGGIEHEGDKAGGDEDRQSIKGDLEKSFAGVKDKGLPDKKSSGAAK
jgi:hypothetical protein